MEDENKRYIKRLVWRMFGLNIVRSRVKKITLLQLDPAWTARDCAPGSLVKITVVIQKLVLRTLQAYQCPQRIESSNQR